MHRPVDGRARAALDAVAADTSASLGHPVLGDGVERDLTAASETSAVVIASDDGTDVGALHLAAPDDDHVTGALVVRPAAHGSGLESALVRAAVEDLRPRGVGVLRYWVFGDAATPDATPARELHQMRIDLPLDGPGAAPTWPEGTRARSFVPGADDAAWLVVNNRAFRHDPDQGGWALETLRGRMTEPWFDPAGFLLAEDTSGLAGFCWTKVHPPVPPIDPEPVGEIYVIGVDPDRQGTGLGRALVVAGLEWLASRGITVGMLFVDAANRPAVGLYEALGFEISRTDRMFECPVAGPS